MDKFTEQYGYSENDWKACLRVLAVLKNQPFQNPNNEHFGTLLTKVHNAAKKQLKKAAQEKRRAAHLKLIAATSIAQKALKNTTTFTPETKIQNTTYVTLRKAQNCYCCNTSFSQLHFFYHRLCPKCAEENYRYRHVEIDLSERNVLLTGGRVKIGYATALKMLRSNANLTVTTRFPALAMAQFQQEKDYEQWKNRLSIYGLDLRNLKAVNAFIEDYQSKYSSLDILINNAAQTIKYDQKYYQPLIAKEWQLGETYKHLASISLNSTPILKELKPLELSLANSVEEKNRFGQPVDHRLKNSWNSTLTEVDLPEVLEVNLINHISPFLLIQGFTPLLKASTHPQKFIINVTSSEGQFSYDNKTMFHPHTNMTKAALNMLTRTSAKEYAQDHIFMNSVDVGWVSTGAHESLRRKQFAEGIIPPLDPVDGSSRIFHPIFESINNKTNFVGQLLKNYRIAKW